MKKYVKAPMLSTSFSQSGKSAKKRFENILSMTAKRNGKVAIILVLCMMLISSALVACDKSIGIIGGSDGPTSIIVTDDTQVKRLYELKTSETVDAEWISKAVRRLPFADNIKEAKFERAINQVSPYDVYIELVCADGETLDRNELDANAVLMMALADDLGKVTFVVGEEEYVFEKKNYPLFDKYRGTFADFAQLYVEVIPYRTNDTDDLVAKAILSTNKDSYLQGECVGEGHIILDEGTLADGTFVVFALASYGEYGFENGNFIKLSGSGVIPVRISFTDNNGVYTLKEYKEPLDGAYWEDSIREMFPKYLHEEVFEKVSTGYDELVSKEHKYAKAYLESIGREAKIGEYRDFPNVLPDMNADASNTLFGRYSAYPYWIGTKERIEDGVRYVYKTDWESHGNGDGLVTYEKYEYETGRSVVKTVINVSNGEIVIAASEPLKA